MKHTATQLLLLFWVSKNQEEIINLLIKDTDAWAEEDLGPGQSAKKRLLKDIPQIWDSEDGRNTIRIEDGEDNAIFLSLTMDDAYFGISTEQHKPPKEQVHTHNLGDITFYVTYA